VGPTTKPDVSSASTTDFVDRKEWPGVVISFAWAGDSAALVISPEGELLWRSKIHKPESRRESQRIIARGGTVDKVGPAYRVNAGLSLSRALGDPSVKAPTHFWRTSRATPEELKSIENMVAFTSSLHKSCRSPDLKLPTLAPALPSDVPLSLPTGAAGVGSSIVLSPSFSSSSSSSSSSYSCLSPLSPTGVKRKNLVLVADDESQLGPIDSVPGSPSHDKVFTKRFKGEKEAQGEKEANKIERESDAKKGKADEEADEASVQQKVEPSSFSSSSSSSSTYLPLADYSFLNAQQITCVPDVTQIYVPPGCLVVMTCDGPYEYLKERHIVSGLRDLVLAKAPASEIASFVTHYAWSSGSNDNLTSTVFWVTSSASGKVVRTPGKNSVADASSSHASPSVGLASTSPAVPLSIPIPPVPLSIPTAASSPSLPVLISPIISPVPSISTLVSSVPSTHVPLSPGPIASSFSTFTSAPLASDGGRVGDPDCRIWTQFLLRRELKTSLGVTKQEQKDQDEHATRALHTLLAASSRESEPEIKIASKPFAVLGISTSSSALMKSDVSAHVTTRSSGYSPCLTIPSTSVILTTPSTTVTLSSPSSDPLSSPSFGRWPTGTSATGCTIGNTDALQKSLPLAVGESASSADPTHTLDPASDQRPPLGQQRWMELDLSCVPMLRFSDLDHEKSSENEKVSTKPADEEVPEEGEVKEGKEEALTSEKLPTAGQHIAQLAKTSVLSGRHLTPFAEVVILVLSLPVDQSPPQLQGCSAESERVCAIYQAHDLIPKLNEKLETTWSKFVLPYYGKVWLNDVRRAGIQAHPTIGRIIWQGARDSRKLTNTKQESDLEVLHRRRASLKLQMRDLAHHQDMAPDAEASTQVPFILSFFSFFL